MDYYAETETEGAPIASMFGPPQTGANIIDLIAAAPMSEADTAAYDRAAYAQRDHHARRQPAYRRHQAGLTAPEMVVVRQRHARDIARARAAGIPIAARPAAKGACPADEPERVIGNDHTPWHPHAR